MNRLKKSFVVIFVLIIYCPIFLDFVYFATNTKLDVKLQGYFDKVTPPTLTRDAYIQGQYQATYEKWLNDSFIPRGLFTKVYNQIEYSCFNLGNRIIGKNNNIFEYHYVADALAIDEYNYADLEKQAELDEYVEHLVSVQQKLKKNNKELVVYITPSKGVHNIEDIPLQYKVLQEENSLRAAEYLKESLSHTNVPYLDGEKLISTQQDYPIFYPTGIHWSRPIEQETSRALMQLLEEVSNKELRDIVLTSMNTSDEPYWRDTDVYDLLNVFSPYPDITYYEYETEREYPEKYDNADILLQGGSFGQGLKADYYDLYNGDDLFYINYDNYILSSTGEMQTIDEWEEIELGAVLDRVDFVVIELQEAAINLYSNGFVAYLDEYLDVYIPREVEGEIYGDNLDATAQEDLEGCKGYWKTTGNYFWTGECSSVTLENKEITKEGLSIELTVPQNLINQGSANIYVYVNQKKIDEIYVSKKGRVELDYTPDYFEGTSDKYEVEIYCDSHFVPQDSGKGTDSRELALRIHYIGERR